MAARFARAPIVSAGPAPGTRCQSERVRSKVAVASSIWPAWK
jgi:hypothetical protein